MEIDFLKKPSLEYFLRRYSFELVIAPLLPSEWKQILELSSSVKSWCLVYFLGAERFQLLQSL
ncbi:hypothetical protein BHF83_11185 [Corynebacterium diphtheriae]|nr:hypothetical protein BHF83_11185 [Corynebacterium diphtheriae]